MRKLGLALMALVMTFVACDDKEDDKTNIGDKEGIVLVTFGSSFEAPQATFDNIDKAAKAKFTGEEIRWGFTSDLIINILRQGEGENGIQKDNDTPEEALKQMIEDGYGKFAVQSLHVIPGEEFDEMKEAIERIEAAYEGVEITVGQPLLSSDADIAAVATVMAAQFATEIAAGPVLFMGHGTPHAADAQYAKLEAELQKINTNFFVGTVEGIGFGEGENEGKGPNAIANIVEELNALALTEKAVTITPLMSIVGDHANNDMNSNEEGSWRNELETAGYTVNAVMKGLGDYTAINEIWLSHLEAVK